MNCLKTGILKYILKISFKSKSPEAGYTFIFEKEVKKIKIKIKKKKHFVDL